MISYEEMEEVLDSVGFQKIESSSSDMKKNYFFLRYYLYLKTDLWFEQLSDLFPIRESKDFGTDSVPIKFTILDDLTILVIVLNHTWRLCYNDFIEIFKSEIRDLKIDKLFASTR